VHDASECGGMFEKSREKRIAELQGYIEFINHLMEGMAIKRGEYMIELSHLEGQQITAEATLDVLLVGP